MRVGLIACLAVLAAGAGSQARAAEVTFTASVDRNEVALNEQVRLTLSISAPDPDLAQDLKLPDTGRLEVTGTHRQESMSFSFSSGSQSYRKIQNVILILTPTRKGSTRIGKARLKYKGKTYTTKPIRIRVVQARKRPPRSRRRPSGWPSSRFPDPFDDDFFRSPLAEPRRKIGENDIFVKAAVSPDVVVTGQQVTVTVRVYARVGARIASIRWPKLDGFFSVDRDVSKESTDQKYINGVLYQYKKLDQKALFPLKPGEMTIGPVDVEVEASSSPFFPAEVRKLKTRPLKIQVVPLPADGRPQGFRAANVGSYSLTAALDTRDAALNQPVTYTLTIRGSGNIQRVRPPELPELPRFKRFDPTVDTQVTKKGIDVKGSKRIEYVLVPLSSGELTIPAMEFSFYDPKAGEYRTIETEPQPVRVEAGHAALSGTPAIQGRQVNILARGFDSTIPYGSTLGGYGPPFYRHALFFPVLVVPPGLYLLVLILGFVRSRMHSDSLRGRMRKAWTRKRKRVKEAAQLAARGDAEDFYAEVKEALMDGIESRTGFVPQGLTLTQLSERMSESGFSNELTDALIREVENCDYGRFAPATSQGEEMLQSLDRVRRMLKAMDRERIRHREATR